MPKSSKATAIGLLISIVFATSGGHSYPVYAQESPLSAAVDLAAEPVEPETEQPQPTGPLADGPSLGSPSHTDEYVRRLPTIGNPPEPVTGIEKMPTGDGDMLERLPATIQNLWTTNPKAGAVDADGSSAALERPAPGQLEYRETPLHVLDDPNQPLPPVFVPPSADGFVKSVDEPLPVEYRPPTDAREGSLPRAYPSVGEDAPRIQWSPWWSSPVSQVPLLGVPTAPVGLQRLMSLALHNSPIVELARIDMIADCGASRSKVDQMVFAVAEH